MRKARRERPFLPFTAGVAYGYITTLIIAAAGALFLLLTDTAESLAGAVSVVAFAVGGFSAGHAAGKLRRQGGMAAGAVCGLLYMLLPLVISLVTLNVGGILLVVKLLLAVTFGAVGGVVGVNSAK